MVSRYNAGNIKRRGRSKLPDTNVLIETEKLRKYFVEEKKFSVKKTRVLKAVDGVNLKIYPGETVGLVGESGCGKSTLGRTILNLYPPTNGVVYYRGENLSSFGLNGANKMRDMRRKMQMIFQDPFASLNPRMTIMRSVRAPLDVYKIGTMQERKEKVESLLEYVGIGKEHVNKYPHEMSGGQRQRVVIARAMILNPEFIVCDEPVSALDVSVRSQVLNLMKDMQKDYNLSYLFISHDLSVVRYLCDKVAVMYLGRIVETASKEELFTHPVHPYTKALLSAIPIPDISAKKNKRIILQGDVPSPLAPPEGCRFHTRCPHASKSCSEAEPYMHKLSDTHYVACNFTDKLI
jgi:oligopeptide/dipeptide ABC transporter, ATP-binding protein, C-terminal domain